MEFVLVKSWISLESVNWWRGCTGCGAWLALSALLEEALQQASWHLAKMLLEGCLIRERDPCLCAHECVCANLDHSYKAWVRLGRPWPPGWSHGQGSCLAIDPLPCAAGHSLLS